MVFVGEVLSASGISLALGSRHGEEFIKTGRKRHVVRELHKPKRRLAEGERNQIRRMDLGSAGTTKDTQGTRAEEESWLGDGAEQTEACPHTVQAVYDWWSSF